MIIRQNYFMYNVIMLKKTCGITSFIVAKQFEGG